MRRNTNEAALEKLRQAKYTTKAIAHNVGDKTSSPNIRLAGSAKEAQMPLFCAEMDGVLTFEKHVAPKEVAN
jgi:hypothetical protein